MIEKTGDRTFCTKCGQKAAECRCEEDNYKICDTCIHPCKASGKRASCSLHDDGNNVDSKVRLHELKNMQGMSEATTKVTGEIPEKIYYYPRSKITEAPRLYYSRVPYWLECDTPPGTLDPAQNFDKQTDTVDSKVSPIPTFQMGEMNLNKPSITEDSGEKKVYQCPNCATSMEVDPSAKPSITEYCTFKNGVCIKRNITESTLAGWIEEFFGMVEGCDIEFDDETKYYDFGDLARFLKEKGV